MRRVKKNPMTRVPDVEAKQMSQEQKRIAADIASVRGGYVRGPFAIWIRIPELAETAHRLGNELRLHGKLDRRLFELSIAIVARHWSAQYEWYAHMRRGIEAGLPPELYEAIRVGNVPKFSDSQEQIVYDCVNELIKSKNLSQKSYDLLVQTLGLDNTIELITDVGFYTMIAMVLNSFDYSVPESVKAGKNPLT